MGLWGCRAPGTPQPPKHRRRDHVVIVGFGPGGQAVAGSLRSQNIPFVAIEMGAGSGIPTVRHQCARSAQENGGALIRINTREPDGPAGTISLPMGAKDALLEIEARMAD